MKVTNKTLGALVLPMGQGIAAGATIDMPASSFDADHYVVSTWLEAGMIETERTEEDDAEDAKPLNRMTNGELQEYITANGGEYQADDTKKTLLANASKIEAQLAEGE